MPVITICPRCQKQLKIPDEALGKAVRCPLCQGTFTTTANATGTAGAAAGASSPPKPISPSAAPPPAPNPAPPPTKPVTPPIGPPLPTSQAVSTRPSSGVVPRSRQRISAEPEAEEQPRRRSAPIEFTVAIKDDPERSLRGTFKGTLTRDGLQLRQKSLGFEVPVGTAVSYRGGSRLSLPLGGRDVVVMLVKPRWYTARLAHDVSEFLNGRKAMSAAKDYEVPIYLFVLAFLPLGIAAIGISAKLLGTGIVAGIVNGALWGGLGGGLAGLSWWLCQREKWPLAARSAACLGVSVAGYGMLGAVAVLSRSGSGIGSSEWQSFAPPGARCSVLMPGNPVGRDETAPTPIGNVRVHMFTLERRQEGSLFMLAYSDYPPRALQADVNQLFDGAQQGAAANIHGKVMSQEPVTLDGIPGREVEISVPKAGSMFIRYYLAGNRLYQVAAAGKSISRQSADLQKLFASFKIVKSDGQPQQPKTAPTQKPADVPPSKSPAETKPAFLEPAAVTKEPDGRIVLRGPRSDVIISRFARDGRLFAGHNNGEGVVWSIPDGKPTKIVPPATSPCSAFALSQDGRWAIRTAHGGPIESFDLGTRRSTTLQPSAPGMISIWAAAISPDSTQAATVHGNGDVKLWDLTANRLLHTLKGHKNQVSSVAFSPDGKILASASWDNTLKFWDSAEGKETASHGMPAGVFNPAWKLAFAPDGGSLAMWRNDNAVFLFDVATRKDRRLSTDHKVSAVAYASDLKTLATGGTDGTITLWDIAADASRGRWSAAGATVNDLCFSPDGRRIAAAVNQEVHVWELAQVKLK